MDPKERLKQLGDVAKAKAKVNHNVAPRTYLRSAVQIEKQVTINVVIVSDVIRTDTVQARSYFEDEDWVSAYILYVRFCQ